MAYVLVNNSPNGVKLRGQASEFWKYKGSECILAGPAECLGGETRLYNPLTDEHVCIEELYARQIAPIVQTLFGTVQAEVPFIKGIAPLYRVTTEEGQSFVATAKHLVLTPERWSYVSELRVGDRVLASVPTLLPRSSEPCLSTFRPGVQHLCRTPQGSQYCCSVCLRLCDEQLLPPAKRGQDAAPSESDVRGYSRGGQRAGDLACEEERIHLCQCADRLASVHCAPFCFREEYTGCCARQAIHAHACCSCLPACRFQRETRPRTQDVSLSQRVCHKQQGDDYLAEYFGSATLFESAVNSFQFGQQPCAWNQVPHTISQFQPSVQASSVCNLSSSTSKLLYATDKVSVPQNTVLSIEYLRTDFYYDLHVPGAEHYLAEGVWHHNTGKTVTCCEKIHVLLNKYPGAQGVMIRKVSSSIVGTVLRTYLRVLGQNSGVRAYGGNSPQWFDYPNGSRLWIAGMDNPQKALSSERDFMYVNQCEDLVLDDWETLITRCTGRGSVMPYTQMLADCNPGAPTHWILNRPSLKVFYSRHEDNPTLYTADGVLTEQGARTLKILDSLTGVRYQRLRLGKWVQAEGAVYEQFTQAEHVKSKDWLIARGVLTPDGAINRDKIKTVIAGQDWGYSNPGVLLVTAVDNDGVDYVLHEVYMSRKLIEWWVAAFVRLTHRYKIDTIDCDPAEPAFIKAYQDAARLHNLKCAVRFATNDIMPGIQTVQQRLKTQENDSARLYFYDGMLEEQDTELLEQKQPVSTLQEMDLYVWPKGVDGKPVKEKPVDMYNHGADTLRYICIGQERMPTVYKVRMA